MSYDIYRAEITETPGQTFRYTIYCYTNDKAYPFSAAGPRVAITRWGARRIARRMLHGLRTAAKEVIR